MHVLTDLGNEISKRRQEERCFERVESDNCSHQKPFRQMLQFHEVITYYYYYYYYTITSTTAAATDVHHHYCYFYHYY